MIVRIVIRTRRPSSEATFVHPMNSAARTAILARGFQETKFARVFPDGWNQDAARFNPSSVAGTVEQLRRLAHGPKLNLRHAVVVFTYEGEPCLSNVDRDLFWKAFGVPIFEQRLSPRNELVAMECEAHAGLHLVGDFGHLRPDKSTCACGNPAPRLSRPSRPARHTHPVDLVRRPKAEALASAPA